MKDLIPRDKLEIWRILDNFLEYNTIEKLTVILKRPVTQKDLDIWLDRINGSAHNLRQVWLHQAIPASNKCCGQS